MAQRGRWKTGDWSSPHGSTLDCDRRHDAGARTRSAVGTSPEHHRYTATTYGLKVGFFYSKLYLRRLRRNWNALLPTADALPRTLRDALDHLDTELRRLHEEATLAGA